MRGPLGPVVGRYSSSDGSQRDGTIRQNRKCRNVVFLVIFIAFWVAMIVNSSLGFNQGNPLRLTYGLDYKGNLCGDKNANPNLRELELRYWVNPNQVYESGLKDSQFKLADAQSICLLDCPIPSEDSLNWVCDYPEGDIHLTIDEWIDRNYDYFEFRTPDMRNTSLQLQGPCYPVIYPSVNVFWSCQFIAHASNMSLRHWQQMGGVNINEGLVIDKSIHNSVNSRSSVLKRYMADIVKSWPVLIVFGGILPLFLLLIWLLMIRHFVAGMPWITVLLFNILIISVTMFFYLKAGWIGNDAVSSIIGEHDPCIHVSGRELTHLCGAAILMTAVMAIAILASVAIHSEPPFIGFSKYPDGRTMHLCLIVMVAAKVIGEVQALMIFPVIPCTILAVFYMFWFSAAFHIFSSGQVCQNNCSSNCCAYDLGSKWVSCERCCGYSIHYTPHIGVAILFHLFVCYWATHFLIACSATVIAGSVASYYWAYGDTLGWIGKVAYHSSKCSLKCVECTIKSVNCNAYIMIAIMGKSFFKSSAIATELIINNILRIGKPCWGLGYVVATLFFGVVEMSIDTIILSFRQDAEEHQGTAQYAPPLLMEALNDQNEMQRLTQ
ncbi:Choline transporter protein 1 [Ancistrocladus abbreviatus]